MTAKTKMTKRVMSVLLSIAVFMTCLPLSVFAANMATQSATIVADAGTAHTWESMMGTDSDGNRYAGRVWVDKSVYTDGQTAVLNSRNEAGSSFDVSLEDDEAFQVIFSALGSSMTTTETTSSSGPMDVVLILDTSTSMDDLTGGVTRLERVIDAANQLLDDLLTLNNARIAIVTYNRDSETVLPLAAYNNGIDLVVTEYMNNGSSDAGVVKAYDDSNTLLGSDDGYTMGTNLQAGIDRGFNILANATNVEGRTPVAIVLTDGQANRANRASFYSGIAAGNSASDESLYLSTLLNAAYNKTKIEAHYGRKQMVYGVGVDLGTNATAHVLMNPGHSSNGFNSSNSDSDIRTAYADFQSWASGNTVTYGNNNNNRWTFDHNYPTLNGAVTDAKIAANINYVDNYYDVTSADLEDTFNQIYEELSSGVFNPISSSSTVDGATGVDNTPLIYVDNIGKYMEVKEIQSVTLFGSSYNVIKNNNGTYTVAAGTGTNPTTNESWNTSEDVIITITENADGSQKLQININQEILPIILEQVTSNTVGETTSANIAEISYDPLRVYYTVGLDSDILLPNGEVDITKIDSGYQFINDTTGEITFYSNAFGVMNTADNNNDGLVDLGDAHVGFKPAAANRYYYHQRNQGIFTGVTAKDGSAINWDASEYGVRYEDGKYDLTWLDYEDYNTMQDDDTVYTYVTYYHPTPSNTDAANAAEEVTYLVYTDWGYLKESVAFYDNDAKVFVNYDATNGHSTADEGYAVPLDKVASTIASYKAANTNADIYAMLGVGSLRTSRLHNMTVAKENNNTQTANMRYAPEYTYETSVIHNGNDVVVWLGNNGRLTTTVPTGIALTKAVTEAIGNADDTYALTVKVPSGVTATPVVKDVNGNDVIADYSGNTLTVNVKAGETVYVSGIPAGTVCEIDEVIPGNADYYIASKTDTVTIPTLSDAIDGTSAQYVAATVTNAPYKYGNLYITKEIASDHNIPESILNKDFEIKVDVGTGLAGNKYLVNNGTATNEYTVAADGTMTFNIKARQTIEVIGLPAGTHATVTEVNVDSHFAVSYRTRNHSGETADNDNAVVIPEDANATAVVINTYTPNSTTVDLNIAGTKNFIIEGNHDSATFDFKVQKWNGTTWEDISGKTAQVTYAANTSGIKTFTIGDVLDGITYSEAGSWAYQVVEVKGAVTNVTYDRTLYTFTVTVTDNGGQLVATVTDLNNTAITDGSYEVTFNNIYHAAPVSIDIEKIVDNKSGDTEVSKAGFRFDAVQTDANWQPLNGGSTLTVYSDAAGEARLTATYTTADTYYYVVSEVSDVKDGWTYSRAKYHVTVTVTGSGDLTSTMTIVGVDTATDETASVTGNNGKITFKNTYDPEDAKIYLDGKVIKNLVGKTLNAGDFTFYVCENGTVPAVRNGNLDSVLLVGTNDYDGNVKFVDFAGELKFDKVGKYEYDVIEANGGLAGMTYDSTIYDLVVEVENDISTGKLVATYYFEDATGSTVTFNNTYTVTPTDYTISGTKILNGRAMQAGEFSFELWEGNTLVETVTNKADGTFTFSKITYTAAGKHVYTIKEVEGNAPGVTYTGVANPVEVTVNVSDNNSVLEVNSYISNANSSDAKVEFINTYDPEDAKVTFKGTKTLKGLPLTNNDFTFKLYKTDHTFDITSASASLVATKRNVDGKFEFEEEVFSTTGSYFYVIVEDATVDPISNIVYDGTHYNLRVQVSDVGDGKLRAKVENLTVGVTGNETGLTHATAEVAFTNATFDEATEKEVYLEGNTSTQIDGSKVAAGDVLTYFITYTNYTGEDVVADIMDTIPAHTSYVDGSASHNGKHVGNHISWILNVPRGESVTVTFNVKVDETEAIVANTAVVRDGVNTYTTNEVVNHTVEEPAKKDVFLASDPSVSIDGKKVYAGDKLLYTISYTNITGEEADVTITDKLPEHTTYVDGSADNNGVYASGKLTWSIENVPAWSTVTVSFEVTVDAEVGAEKFTNEADVDDGKNEYTTNEVLTYTVEDDVEKKVSFADNTDINIDGNKVKAGDVLVYFISYKNTSFEKATVVITDKLSEFTTYVDGSANNNGVYANGELSWTIEVEAGATVTVSFKATVNNVENATVTNKATVVEGKNTYTTNEVSTPIEIPQTPPTAPQTGDNSNLWLWFALMFVSGGGIISTTVYGMKRKESEEN